MFGPGSRYDEAERRDEMPHIRTIGPDDATGELKRHYDAAIKRAGRVYNVVSIQGLNPKEMAASIRLYQVLMMSPDGLPRPVREMLATTVAREMDCFY
jgi:alkylhydroperoxidase family enzyme